MKIVHQKVDANMSSVHKARAHTADIESLIVQGLDLTINKVKNNWDGSHPINNYSLYVENIRNLLRYIDILEKSSGVSHSQLEEIGDVVDNEVDKLYMALAKGNIEDYELVKVLECILRVNSVIGR